MSETHTLILGGVAGLTILLGLPLARVRRPLPRTRQFASAVAIGILLFLIWDVLSHAYGPIAQALFDLHRRRGGLLPVFGYGSLFFAGIGVGFVSLVYYERVLGRRPAGRDGPGAMTATAGPMHRWSAAGLSPASRLALLISVGIGLHNFGEGLAIGASAARGDIGLATLLVIGFALHNATEGFGIVAPLAAAGERPSRRFLLSMGLIGGGPTFVGTVVGRQFTSPAVDVAFLALAAGSILYVVIQLVGIGLKMGRREYLVWGVYVGLVLGFVTDMILTAGGG